MKLAEWVRVNRVHPQTAYQRFRQDWHRDRLARSGVEHLESALAAVGRRVLVAGPGETAGDRVRAHLEVLTSRCARLYGRRGARNRAIRAITAARRGDEAGAA